MYKYRVFFSFSKKMLSMYFFFKFLCLISISNYVKTESEVPEPIFNIMALGHSGLLIFWKPFGNTSCELLLKFKKNQGRKFIEGNTSDENKHASISIPCAKGQFMKSNLAENIVYTFEIEKFGERSVDIYPLKGKTDLRTNTVPAKPDFTFEQDESNSVVRWIPCGRERNCGGRSPGTHFLIKYRDLSSRQKTIIFTQTDDGRVTIFAGRIYEIIVTSVNGDFQTDSDPKEIFIPPISSPVWYVKILPLNDSSLILDWKAPKETLLPIDKYQIEVHRKLNDGNDNPMVYTLTTGPFEKLKHSSASILIKNVQPAMEYTIYIIPQSYDGELGIEYPINYLPRAFDEDSPVAMPSISYSTEFTPPKYCKIIIKWLPCGKMFDCKNTNPGSDYILEHKPDEYSVHGTICEWPEVSIHKIGIKSVIYFVRRYRVYDIKVISVRGSKYSAPFLTTIETNACKSDE